MKFLCICQYGHSRSVAMCRVLHGRGHEAVAVGAGTGRSAVPCLAAWADVIVTMQPQFGSVVPPTEYGKLVCVDVGPDVWSNPYNGELLKLLGVEADKHGW